jgi:hypothetical protein
MAELRRIDEPATGLSTKERIGEIIGWPNGFSVHMGQTSGSDEHSHNKTKFGWPERRRRPKVSAVSQMTIRSINFLAKQKEICRNPAKLTFTLHLMTNSRNENGNIPGFLRSR